MKAQITIDDLSKLDLRVGEVVNAQEVTDSNKLLQLLVDFGEEVGQKTIYSGIKKWYSADSLIGKKFIFIVNLAPRDFKFGISEGMILAAESNDEPVLLIPEKDVTAGSKIS